MELFWSEQESIKITVAQAVDQYLSNKDFWTQTKINNTYAQVIIFSKSRVISEYLFKKHVKKLDPDEPNIIDFDFIFKEMTYGSDIQMKKDLIKTKEEQGNDYDNKIHIDLV